MDSPYPPACPNYLRIRSNRRSEARSRHGPLKRRACFPPFSAFASTARRKFNGMTKVRDSCDLLAHGADRAKTGLPVAVALPDVPAATARAQRRIAEQAEVNMRPREK